MKDWQDYTLKATGTGLFTAFIAELFQRKVNSMRESVGLPKIHHYQLGIGLAVPGAIQHEQKWSPYATGAGVALILHDARDMYKMIKSVYRLPNRDLSAGFGSETLGALPTSEFHKIPDYPLKARYQALAGHIQKIISEDTVHPYVRKVAVDIIKQHGYDGHQTEEILKAFQQYIFQNVTYIYDGRRKGLERLQHGYITLPYAEDNPTGQGCGDCDCRVLLLCGMAKSVGIKDIHAVMIAQEGSPYFSHILAAWNKDGKKPLKWRRCVAIETIPVGLDESRNPIFPKWGWRPKASKVGFIDLDEI